MNKHQIIIDTLENLIKKSTDIDQAIILQEILNHSSMFNEYLNIRFIRMNNEILFNLNYCNGFGIKIDQNSFFSSDDYYDKTIKRGSIKKLFNKGHELTKEHS